jgi:hypothetical protein
MMKKMMIIIALAFALMLAGCTGQQGSPGYPSGSANFQMCVSQCGSGNAGNGTLCKDGCSFTEAASTKSTALCDSLIDKSNRPSCYGTVAKASSNIKVCDALNATDKNYCVSVFGSPGGN